MKLNTGSKIKETYTRKTKGRKVGRCAQSHKRVFLPVLVPVLLSSCALNPSVAPALGRSGPVNLAEDHLKNEGSDEIQAELFAKSFKRARCAASALSDASKSSSDASNSSSCSSVVDSELESEAQRAYTQMVKDGFGLVYANCSHFFRSEGGAQEWIAVVRGAVTAAGTLATAMAAATRAANGVTTGFAIGTTSA